MKKKVFFLLFIMFNINIFSNYNQKILNKEIVPKMKYAVDFEIPITNGEFPNEKIMQEIAYNEKMNNPGYENYFIHFYLPNMKLGSGAFATSNNNNNSNPNMKVNILYYTLINNPKYSDRLKEDSKGNFYLENYTNQKNKNNINKIKIDSIDNIGAKIIIEYFTTNGKLEIHGFSNLPQGTELTVELENDKFKYNAQNGVTILKDGSFIAGPFSDKGNRLKKGYYTIIITSPYVFLQPENVQKIIGKKGEKLKSDITVEEDGEYFIDYNLKININN